MRTYYGYKLVSYNYSARLDVFTKRSERRPSSRMYQGQRRDTEIGWYVLEKNLYARLHELGFTDNQIEQAKVDSYWVEGHRAD